MRLLSEISISILSLAPSVCDGIGVTSFDLGVVSSLLDESFYMPD